MATMVEERAPGRARVSKAHRSPETLVFCAATLVALVHGLDDAFVHRQPGLGPGQHALVALLAVVGAAGAIAVYPSLRAAAKTAVALSFGVFASLHGFLHVMHVDLDGAAASDVTGVLAGAAGAVLIGLAVATPWLHRGEGKAGPRRRWAYRVLALPAVLLGAIFVLGPIGMATFDAHKYREPIGAAPDASYQDVSFEASDGLDLKGWYRPSENGAAVLLVHGGGGDRTGAVAHAKALVRHGYGVLLYDARGRGESEGSPNGYGWDWAKDVDGALAFLKARDDVEPGRIGALGLSTGADVLLEVAGDGDELKAVVSDGAAAGSYEDWYRLRGTEIGVVPGFVMFKAIELFTGDDPGPALEDQVARMSEPLLLISGERDVEYEFNLSYAAKAGGPVEHWNLPDVTHTAGLRKRPAEYEKRVAAFFDANL